MTPSTGTQFVYVTYIRTTAEKLWAALTQVDLQREFFFGSTQQTNWAVGSPWRMTGKDGVVTDAGEVLAFEPMQRILLKWHNEFRPELKAEGDTTCEFTLEPAGDSIKLTVRHGSERPDSQVIKAVSGGWPKILSNLKSLLETGDVAVR